MVTLLIIYVFVTALNFFVVSGSGKAVMMMPILSPWARCLESISRLWCLPISWATA